MSADSELKEFLKQYFKRRQDEELEKMIGYSQYLQLSKEDDDDATHSFHEMMYCITSILMELKKGQDTRALEDVIFSQEYVAEKCDMIKQWASMYYKEIGSKIDG